MRFYFFASFIVFCIWLGYEIHKHRNMEAKDYEAFWDREHAANSTRRKSLDGLNYITIPVEAEDCKAEDLAAFLEGFAQGAVCTVQAEIRKGTGCESDRIFQYRSEARIWRSEY